jgi:hypothetical protein
MESSAPDTVKAYTVRIEGAPGEKLRKLTAADVVELAGQFEPYNITVAQDPKKGSTATFQVHKRFQHTVSRACHL